MRDVFVHFVHKEYDNIIADSAKRPIMVLYRGGGDVGRFWKTVMYKGRLCDTSFEKSPCPCPHQFGKNMFQLLSSIC